jgi:hypothetical protein
MISDNFRARVGILVLISLASVGWIVLLSQNPLVLMKARLRYMQATVGGVNFESGPCLGKIDDDWVVDIAHVPRRKVDDLSQNQCKDRLLKKIRHFVEMSPAGEIIIME